MREIKFRALYKSLNQMEYINDLYWFEENGVHSNNDYDYEIMQYTGLKDKNGKEIYEGDIVAIYEVDFEEVDRIENEIDVCYYVDKDHELPIIEVGKDVVTMERFPRFWLKNEEFGYEGEYLISVNDCVVIGNIYENPELLEVKNES